MNIYRLSHGWCSHTWPRWLCGVIQNVLVFSDGIMVESWKWLFTPHIVQKLSVYGLNSFHGMSILSVSFGEAVDHSVDFFFGPFNFSKTPFRSNISFMPLRSMERFPIEISRIANGLLGLVVGSQGRLFKSAHWVYCKYRKLIYFITESMTMHA